MQCAPFSFRPSNRHPSACGLLERRGEKINEDCRNSGNCDNTALSLLCLSLLHPSLEDLLPNYDLPKSFSVAAMSQVLWPHPLYLPRLTLEQTPLLSTANFTHVSQTLATELFAPLAEEGKTSYISSIVQL